MVRGEGVPLLENRVVHWVSTPFEGGSVDVPIRLIRLLHRLQAGQTLAEIKRDIPDITMKALLYARAYYAAHFPDHYKSTFRSSIERVLVDENLDQHIVTDGARRAFGRAAHIDYADMRSAPDIQVWKYACQNGFNAIISKDRAQVISRKHLDLTRCAVLAWKMRLQTNGGYVDKYLRALPKIIHVRGDRVAGRQIAKMLVVHRQSIAEIFDECTSPIIELSVGAAKPGDSYIDIFEGGRKRRLLNHRDMIVRGVVSEFDMSHLPVKERKAVVAKIKRMVEHMLKSDPARQQLQGRDIELVQMTMKQTIEASAIGDPLLVPIKQRRFAA